MHARICSRLAWSYAKWRQVRCLFVGKVLELRSMPSRKAGRPGESVRNARANQQNDMLSFANILRG
jgi:hypothetical protein